MYIYSEQVALTIAMSLYNKYMPNKIQRKSSTKDMQENVHCNTTHSIIKQQNSGTRL
jgi:hypothetical protein